MSCGSWALEWACGAGRFASLDQAPPGSGCSSRRQDHSAFYILCSALNLRPRVKPSAARAQSRRHGCARCVEDVFSSAATSTTPHGERAQAEEREHRRFRHCHRRVGKALSEGLGIVKTRISRTVSRDSYTCTNRFIRPIGRGANIRTVKRKCEAVASLCILHSAFFILP
jgi:hypothetical protein